MPSRRQRRRDAKAHRHSRPSAPSGAEVIVREAASVERLAYTRTQAAEALGVSRSTFDGRMLPLLETVEMPWGAKLIPVDELDRLITERRRPAQAKPTGPKPGRPAVVPVELAHLIYAERAAGKSLGQIARDLNADGAALAHGGKQWWPSTVRAVLQREPDPTSVVARPVA
jgi:hypothetical protein